MFKTRIKNKKVRHVLEFDQSKWLKPYIEFNTEKRIEAEKNGDKDGRAFCKLMSNADFGKTMKSLRNRVEVRMVNNTKLFEADIKTKLCSTSTTTSTLNKPPFIGTCILELSKVPIYEFHYDYIKNKYGNK